MALTDTEIRRSRPSEKPYKLSDSGGLHLLVTPSGGRLWRWKCRFQGIEKQMAFGPYPALSLADARERRDAARKRLANGIDPMVPDRRAKVVDLRHLPRRLFNLASLPFDHSLVRISRRFPKLLAERRTVEGARVELVKQTIS